ncbi:MAG: hypothetical protein KKE96_02520 [Candidatus Altiarchaeota archaeon]|nr:hypothetical protein [Candidatus Altiarchaeota archaeon]
MININISRKHIISLVFIVAVATFINYTIAQGGVQSHPISEVTNLDANGDGVVDLANNSNYLGGQLPAYYEGGGCAGPFSVQLKGLSADCDTKCSSLGKTCAFATLDGGGYVLDLASCSTGGTRQCVCCA